MGQLGPLVNVPYLDTVEEAMSFSYRQLRKALDERVILANQKGETMFFSIIPELGVWGIPDCADCTDGKHSLIVESRTT